MKDKTLIAILSILSISLAVLTITMFITYVNIKGNSFSSEKEEQQTEVDYSNHFISKYLEFTPKQIELFKIVNDYHIASKHKIGMQIYKVNEEFSKKLSLGNITREDEAIFYEKIMQLHKNLQQIGYEYYKKIMDICDEEQKIKCTLFFRTTICIDGSACKILKEI